MYRIRDLLVHVAKLARSLIISSIDLYPAGSPLLLPVEYYQVGPTW